MTRCKSSPGTDLKPPPDVTKEEILKKTNGEEEIKTLVRISSKKNILLRGEVNAKHLKGGKDTPHSLKWANDKFNDIIRSHQSSHHRTGEKKIKIKFKKN